MVLSENLLLSIGENLLLSLSGNATFFGLFLLFLFFWCFVSHFLLCVFYLSIYFLSICFDNCVSMFDSHPLNDGCMFG